MRKNSATAADVNPSLAASSVALASACALASVVEDISWANVVAIAVSTAGSTPLIVTCPLLTPMLVLLLPVTLCTTAGCTVGGACAHAVPMDAASEPMVATARISIIVLAPLLAVQSRYAEACCSMRQQPVHPLNRDLSRNGHVVPVTAVARTCVAG